MSEIHSRSLASYSDGLVDCDAIARVFTGILDSFSTLHFLDCCALLEAIVLRDRLIMTAVPDSGTPPPIGLLDYWNGVAS